MTEYMYDVYSQLRHHDLIVPKSYTMPNYRGTYVANSKKFRNESQIVTDVYGKNMDLTSLLPIIYKKFGKYINSNFHSVGNLAPLYSNILYSGYFGINMYNQRYEGYEKSYYGVEKTQDNYLIMGSHDGEKFLQSTVDIHKNTDIPGLKKSIYTKSQISKYTTYCLSTVCLIATCYEFFNCFLKS